MARAAGTQFPKPSVVFNAFLMYASKCVFAKSVSSYIRSTFPQAAVFIHYS